MEIRKVLIVDEDADIRAVAQMGLEDSVDWAVCHASSGFEALSIAARERPDVILLDVMMPGMDGITTLRHLREHPATATLPVIFVTAKVQVHEIDHYLDLDAIGCIAKPFDPLTLAREIRRLVDSARGTA